MRVECIREGQGLKETHLTFTPLKKKAKNGGDEMLFGVAYGQCILSIRAQNTLTKHAVRVTFGRILSCC